MMCTTIVSQYVERNLSDTTNRTYTDVLEHVDACTMQEIYFIYILPVVVVIGTISNSLTIFVFRQNKMKAMSVGFYLYVYAVVNLLNLYLAYGLSWLSIVAEVQPLKDLSDCGCRIWEFVYRIVAYSGIWILVATLVDRYVSVYHPKMAVTMCQVFMAKLAIIMVLTGLLVISVHSMWSYELRDGLCQWIEEDLHTFIWRWTSASCYVFIPLIALFVINTILLFDKCTNDHRSQSPGSDQDRVPVDLTNTVLALSFAYLLFSTPATVVNIIDTSLSNKQMNDVSFMMHLGNIRLVSNLLSCGNPTIVVFVCAVFSGTFRREFREAFHNLFFNKQSGQTEPEQLKVSSDHRLAIVEDIEYKECYETLL